MVVVEGRAQRAARTMMALAQAQPAHAAAAAPSVAALVDAVLSRWELLHVALRDRPAGSPCGSHAPCSSKRPRRRHARMHPSHPLHHAAFCGRPPHGQRPAAALLPRSAARCRCGSNSRARARATPSAAAAAHATGTQPPPTTAAQGTFPTAGAARTWAHRRRHQTYGPTATERRRPSPPHTQLYRTRRMDHRCGPPHFGCVLRRLLALLPPISRAYSSRRRTRLPEQCRRVRCSRLRRPLALPPPPRWVLRGGWRP